MEGSAASTAAAAGEGSALAASIFAAGSASIFAAGAATASRNESREYESQSEFGDRTELATQRYFTGFVDLKFGRTISTENRIQSGQDKKSAEARYALHSSRVALSKERRSGQLQCGIDGPGSQEPTEIASIHPSTKC